MSEKYLTNIEKFISENNSQEALDECLRTNNYFLGLLLSYSLKNKMMIDKFTNIINKIMTESKIINQND